jgi:multidrug resistance efflux pump
MDKVRWLAPACAALLLLAPWHAPAWAGDGAPATVVVKRGPLSAALDVEGTLVPEHHAQVAPKFEAYGGKLEILEAAPEGPVVKGQILLRLDDETYHREVRAKERDLAIARLDLERSEQAQARRKQGWDLGRGGWARALDDAVRRKKLADEALERFVDVERKLREEDARAELEGRRIALTNTQEELAQLEKMYKEDDMVEETEGIVLKRNRRHLERMLASFQRYKNRWEYDQTVKLPRELERLTTEAQRAAANLTWLQTTRPLEVKKAELELEKAREKADAAERALGKLRQDAGAFLLTAPMAGQAVRGRLEHGAWKDLGDDEAYEAGKTVRAGQVLYTVVDDGDLQVRTQVKEADLAEVRPGQPASVTTPLTGKEPLEAEVARVARYGTQGNYAVVLRLLASDGRLRTGLGCKAQIVRARGDDVLSVPVGCLRHEDGKDWVWRLGADGPVRTEVRVGHGLAGRAELVEGVSAGSVLLARPPQEAPGK